MRLVLGACNAFLLLGACNAFDEPAPEDAFVDGPPGTTIFPTAPVISAPGFPTSGGASSGGLPNAGSMPPEPPVQVAPPVPTFPPPELPCGGLGFDNDGVSQADEEDAGLDSCSVDSDGDGCPDAFELHAGGCDDRGDVLLGKACFFFPAPTQVEYLVPGTRSFDEVRLALPLELRDGAHEPDAQGVRPVRELRRVRFSAVPVGAAPQDAASVDNDRFVDVQAGARLSFTVTLEETIDSLADGASFVGELQLVGDGQTLSTHTVVLVTEGPCQRVILE